MIRHIKRNILKRRLRTNKIKEAWSEIQEAKRAKAKKVEE